MLQAAKSCGWRGWVRMPTLTQAGRTARRNGGAAPPTSRKPRSRGRRVDHERDPLVRRARQGAARTPGIAPGPAARRGFFASPRPVKASHPSPSRSGAAATERDGGGRWGHGSQGRSFYAHPYKTQHHTHHQASPGRPPFILSAPAWNTFVESRRSGHRSVPREGSEKD